MTPHEFEHPVVFFANGIGDGLLALPTLRALVSLFDHRLGIVCPRTIHDVFYFDLPFRKVVTPAFHGRPRQFTTGVADEIGPCDLFISLVPWRSESLDRLMCALRPSMSIGFWKHFDIALEQDPGKHALELAFEVVHSLAANLELDDFTAPPPLVPHAKQLVDDVNRRIPEGMRLLAAHNETLPTKRWDEDRFGRAIDEILEAHPELFVLCLSVEEDFGVRRNRGRVLRVPGLPLSVAVACAAASDFFVGVDSCMLHVADFFRVPGVGMFGPTTPGEFGFRLGPHRHVGGTGSMETIEVTDVVDEFESLYEQAVESSE